MLRPLRALVAAAALFLAPATASAATFDPDLTWRVIQTEHFRIHFHQGEEQLADEFAQMIEEVYDTMYAELRWKPQRRTEVILIDRTDSANGYASTVPYNTIVIYVTGPQEDSNLSYYEDWSKTIATHEYTHILHIDTNHGLVRLARAAVGRIASTNRVTPWWMVEGFATLQETRHTAGGRGRAPLADMVKRTAVLEDAFPPLGNLDGLQPDPPAGNLRYLFGQDLMQYVSDRQGNQVWTRWIHHYGSSVPYFLPGRWILGRGFNKLYREWKAHLFAKYGAVADEVRAVGIREGRPVSNTAYSCWAPSFAPDGEKLVWSCHDLRRGAAIWLSDGEGYGAEIILDRRSAKNFTWRRDSEAFVYAGTHVVNRFNTWSDVYMHVLGTENVSGLTNGARARDPDFSPDGSRLMVVTNRAQDNQLEVMTVDKRRERLTNVTDHTQFSTPRYSPDGKVLAVSVWSQGRRDLWLYGTDGTPLRKLTADSANDRDPAWSGDGKYLYFASERTGIPNIFAIDTDTERLYQVTNVLTGAVMPSASATRPLLAYQQYTQDGWEVRLLDVDPERWIDRGLLPRTPTHNTPIRELTDLVEHPVEADDAVAWVGEPLRKRVVGAPADTLPFAAALQAPDESTDTFDQALAEDVFGEEKEYPFRIKPKRYNPLPTLAPRYWLPFVQSTGLSVPAAEPFDFLPPLVVGGVTGTADPLRFVGWSASINFRTDVNYVGGGGSVTINRWIPVYSFGGFRTAVPFGKLYTYDPNEPVHPDGSITIYDSGQIYWENRTQFWASVNYPYTHRTWIFARYTFTIRDELFDLPENTYLGLVPARGYTGALEGGWRYSWSQPTRYAITTEDGRIFSLVGGVMSPYIGTFIENEEGELEPFTQVQITAELREYVVNPWIPNHVLAFRAAGGVTLGNTSFFGSSQLGDSIGDGAFYATPDESRMLRGYDRAADIGDMYWLGGLEYRFPIWRIQRGFGVLPAFIRDLSGAAFLDAGNAFNEVRTIQDTVRGSLAGAGVELRATVVLGWALFFTGRVGYAVALNNDLDGDGFVSEGEGGHRPLSTDAFYFRLGGSF